MNNNQFNNSSSENIKCVARCRPMNSKEKSLGIKCISITQDSKVVLVENKDDKSQPIKGQYGMEKVFDENISQEEIFKEVGEPIMKSFIGGYNCTIFCYGQTGAGKTYTIMGPLDNLFDESSPKHGIIPRIIHFLFNEKEKVINLITNNTTEKCKDIKYNFKTSVMEIYQEQIIDLLNPVTETNPYFNLYNNINIINKKDQNELKIKEDPKKGMYIQGITEEEIESVKQAKNLILTGLKSRHVAATEMNAESSRSHIIFSLYLNAEYTNSKNAKIQKSSRLHLIDLAGSERQKKTKTLGDRIKEACMINKSLSTLGNVINALVEVAEGKGKYIPFRDSKLTFFLKDSLGGNSKTTIIANISSSLMSVGETISTLKFVQRAKLIKNNICLNVSVQENIETLHEEIRRLKAIIAKEGYFDLNLLDNDNISNNKEKENYICPICHNQPIEIRQQQVMNQLKDDIINLTNTIVKNFNFGEELKKQLIYINDNEFGNYGLKFFDIVDQYKIQYDKQLNNLGTQIKLLNEFYEEARDDLNQVNKKIKEYKPSDPMDSLIFDKVGNLNNKMNEIMKKFKDCNIEEFNNLKMENEALKKEIEITKEFKKILEMKRKENNIKKLNEKEKIITKAIDKFIKTNDDIKNFMSENFLGQPMLKNELIFLEKSKYDLLLFQLDEEKIMNNSLRKQIEDMESENYLINLELSKMKTQLEKFKNFKSLGKLNFLKTMNEEDSFVSPTKKKLMGRKSVMLTDYKKGNEIGNININIKNCDELSSEISKTKTVKYKNIEAEKRNSISNQLASEIIKMKESLEDLNDDLEEKMIANDELIEKNEQLEEEINNLNNELENERRNNEENKEQIESLYTQIELYENKIEDLVKFKNNTETKIEELFKENNNLNSSFEDLNKLFNQIFDICNNKCFELFKKNKNYFINIQYFEKEIKTKENIIKDLNNRCNTYFSLLQENEKEIKEILKLNEENNNKINNFCITSINEIERLRKSFNNFIIDNDIEINDVIKSMDMNNIQINNCLNEFNNVLNKTEKNINGFICKTNSNYNQLISFYNNDLNKFNNYRNVISHQKKNILKYLDDSDNNIEETKILVSKNQEELNILSNKFEDLICFYQNKCYSLLKCIEKLDKEKDIFKGKNINLENEFNKSANINKLNVENNKHLKEKIEEDKNQINNLNLKIKEYQNENDLLNEKIEVKIELIKKLKENINSNDINIEKLNKNNLDLLKEIEEIKAKSLYCKIKDQEKESQINELNAKISNLNNEISNKNDDINRLNKKIKNLQIDFNSLKESKNILLKQLKEKEIEIKNNNEKIFNLNAKYDSLLKSKDENIRKLNKKIRFQKNQISNNQKNGKNNITLFQKHKYLDNKEQFDMSIFEINKIKETCNYLFQEKLKLEEIQIKLNMKYNVTKIIMNLGIQLQEEFNIYKTKNNKEDINDSEDIIDIFINEKIKKCKEDINITQSKITNKLIEKKKINNQLLARIKIHKEEIENKFNENISNLKLLFKKLNENEGIDNGKENKNLTQIMQEIIDKHKECILYERNINSNKYIEANAINIERNQIKEIIINIKNTCHNKNEIIDEILPLIVNSMNSLKNIELNIDIQIKYYDYRKQNNIENKTTKSYEIIKFVEEYNNLKLTIIDIKNKFMKLYEEFMIFKGKLLNDENIYNNQLEEEELINVGEANNEKIEVNNEIINEINNFKNDISNKKNFLIGLYNNNKNVLNIYSDLLKNCKNSDINLSMYLSQQEKDINEILSKRDNLESDINKLKTDFLILNTLPNHYLINKVFLINDIYIFKIQKLEEKIKLIFGQNFDIKNIYKKSINPKLIWKKSDIPKLTKDIMILKEERNQIENDLNTLKAAIDSALDENGNKNQITILFKIKEENKNLKRELKIIKEKNILLQENLKDFNKNNIIYNNELLAIENSSQKFSEYLLTNNSNSSLNDFYNKNYKKNPIINFNNSYSKISKENLENEETMKKKLFCKNYNVNKSCIFENHSSCKKVKKRFSSTEK